MKLGCQVANTTQPLLGKIWVRIWLHHFKHILEFSVHRGLSWKDWVIVTFSFWHPSQGALDSRESLHTCWKTAHSRGKGVRTDAEKKPTLMRRELLFVLESLWVKHRRIYSLCNFIVCKRNLWLHCLKCIWSWHYLFRKSSFANFLFHCLYSALHFIQALL